MRLSIVVPCVVCGLLSPSVSYADEAIAHAAEARADALEKDNKLAESCTYRETAAKEGPDFKRKWAVGICYEGAGKIATAWMFYDAALQFALAESSLHPNDDLLKEQARRAKIKVDDIAAKVPKLRLVVSEKVTGLAIVRGEDPIAESVWGTDIPLDPGDYSLAAHAPGYEPFTTKFTLKAGDVTTVNIPALTCARPAVNGKCSSCGEFEAWSATTTKCECATGYTRNEQSKTCALNAPPTTASTTPTTPPPAQTSHGVPALTWVLGGVGVVSLATAGVSLLVGNGKWQDAQSNHCGAGNVCDGTGISEEKSAMTLAGVSAATFIAGLVLVAGGVTVFAIGSKSETALKTSVLLTPGGLSVVGSF